MSKRFLTARSLPRLEYSPLCFAGLESTRRQLRRVRNIWAEAYLRQTKRDRPPYLHHPEDRFADEASSWLEDQIRHVPERERETDLTTAQDVLHARQQFACKGGVAPVTSSPQYRQRVAFCRSCPL